MANHQNQFLDQLVGDLKPVTPIEKDGPALMKALSLSFAAIGGYLYLMGAFENVDLMWMNAVFYAQIVLIGMTFGICTWLSVKMARPEARMTWKVIGLASLPLLGMVALLVYGWMTEAPGGPMSMKRAHCTYEIFVMGWLPIVMLLGRLRKGYPTESRRLALTMGLAGVSLPVGFMHFACFYQPKHVSIYHLGPALVIVAIVFFIGRKLWR